MAPRTPHVPDQPSDVVVTGVGACAAVGRSPAEVHAALCSGEPGSRTASGGRDASHGGVPAARIIGGQAASELAVAVAEQATSGLPTRSALWVICATTAADVGAAEESWRRHGRDPCVDRDVDGLLAHRPGLAVQAALGSGCPAWTVSSACTSGGLAVIQAADLVRKGRASAALAVGVDTVCEMTTGGFSALGLVSKTRCRPFDTARDGLKLGDGAAALLLERRDVALARGAVPLATLAGNASTSDGHSLTAPHPDGLALQRAIREALRGAGAPGLVVAHATGTRANDAAEAHALFAQLPDVPVTATKGTLGHTLGAAAILDAAVAIMVLQTGRVPAIQGLQTPTADLRFVLQTCMLHPRSILTTSAAFGGGTCALLWGRA
jgi:3-oxoacyl-[acyl-carrier-protein] synthase I